ncbi:2-succinyl-5-enolpyruvyl-6-hydroxy-3-cyclohexene-1-carboxylic-acid synthase [soil metagenome]
MATSTAATFCATLVDEWVRAGLTDAVIAPGSRSTPLTVALAVDGRLRVHVHHDERAAGFGALGLGLATGRPAPVVTTSGPAAVELHPAVVEAHQAGVPLIACTADRPAELQQVGAPQTVDQNRLFGVAVRWFVEPGVPDDAARRTWRSLAARSVLEATGRRPGPVHLNLAFRDPLVGDAGDLPPGRDDGRPWHELTVSSGLTEPLVEVVLERLGGRRGVIVAGAGTDDPAAVHCLAVALGWPVLADPRSNARLPAATTVAHADALLRHRGFADAHRPEAVLRLGALPASKVVGEWLATCEADQVAVDRHGAWHDPDRTAALVVAADPSTLCGLLADRLAHHASAVDWVRRWHQSDDRAAVALQGVLDRHDEPTEPGTARATATALPDGATLVVASSMPVRDLEWYCAPRTGLKVLANRGANGIDGVVSTAVGVALAGGPTAVLLGDVALLHDSSGLIGISDRGIDLTIVCVDNDGGGIFSFLPQASTLPAEQFDRLFGTPHGVDLAALVAVHGVPTERPSTADEVGPAVARAANAGGVHLVLVRTDRAANVAVHDELHAAVAAAIDADDSAPTSR